MHWSAMNCAVTHEETCSLFQVRTLKTEYKMKIDKYNKIRKNQGGQAHTEIKESKWAAYAYDATWVSHELISDLAHLLFNEEGPGLTI